MSPPPSPPLFGLGSKSVSHSLFLSVCPLQVGVDELCAVPVLPVDVQLRGRRPVGQGLPDRHRGHALRDHIAGNGFGEPERPRSHIRHPS